MLPPGSLRILLVEDNAINQKIAAKLLEQLGYACTIASGGQEGLARVRQQPYDLIFLDIELPDMDGYETLRQLREIESETTTSPAAVIALTGFARPADRQRSLDAGMIDHLTKPLKRERLKAAIDACLAAGAQS